MSLESYYRHFWKISKNSVKCNLCSSILISTDINDYKQCKCGHISIDGGLEYTKLSYAYNGNYTNLCEYRQYTSAELIDLINTYSYELKRYSVYSDTYYRRMIEAAKYYLNLWYNK